MIDLAKVFVMQAHIAGQEIHYNEFKMNKIWYECLPIDGYMGWNWLDYKYRIKLPTGSEYVYEDGDLAFRAVSPSDTHFLNEDYKVELNEEGNLSLNKYFIITPITEATEMPDFIKEKRIKPVETDELDDIPDADGLIVDGVIGAEEPVRHPELMELLYEADFKYNHAKLLKAIIQHLPEKN